MKNNRQFYAIRREIEKTIKEMCPGIQNKSGLYFYTREQGGFKFAYVGKAQHLIDRLVSHSTGYSQHIDISLKTYHLWSETNLTGWKISYKYFLESELDEREREYILKAHQGGFQLYNVETGGTTGKTDIGARKAAKGYRQGVEYGKKQASKEVANLFEKHLNYSQKSDKPNKNQEKAMEKFKAFLELHKQSE